VIDHIKTEKNVKKVEKLLKYELRRCRVEAVDKIAKDLEKVTIRHISKIFYWRVNKLKERSQSGPVPVKDKNGATISDKERVKERLGEHFVNVLHQDRATEKKYI